MRSILTFLIITLLNFTFVQAQRQFETEARAIGLKSMEEFKSFLALPNDASKPEDIEANIAWAKMQLQSLGFEVNTLELFKLISSKKNFSITSFTCKSQC